MTTTQLVIAVRNKCKRALNTYIKKKKDELLERYGAEFFLLFHGYSKNTANVKKLWMHICERAFDTWALELSELHDSESVTFTDSEENVE